MWLIITVNSNLNATTRGDRLKEQCCVGAAEHSSAVNHDAVNELPQMKFWAGLWQNMVTRRWVTFKYYFLCFSEF